MYGRVGSTKMMLTSHKDIKKPSTSDRIAHNTFTTMTVSLLWRRVILVPILLLALWMLTDDDTQEEDGSKNNSSQHQQHHLAVWTALHRHPPCLRVFRSLFELDLILWGVVFSLFVWSKTLGSHVAGKLLFGPLKEEEGIHGMLHQDSRGNDVYRPVTGDDDDDDDDDENELGQDDLADNIKDKERDPDEPSQKIQQHEARTKESYLRTTPPSTTSVANAALDLLLLTLLSLFFFTWSSAEGGRYIDGMSTFRLVANIAAPTFPLILFSFVALVVVSPWNTRRRKFWKIIFYTVAAPMYSVDFRDGFVGDVLTSSVRPMQDIAFTIFYFLSGLRGWWSDKYDLDDAVQPVEQSWLLHTVILPMCMVSPLWWRFLQNLRQSYDYQKRWPYLGNAAKYMVAAEVAMFGVFDPMRRQSRLWIACFVLATMYQVWWDIFMDWGLLTWSKQGGILPQLRPARAYRYRWTYWLIFAINLVLRFGWSWSFMPARYLTQAGVLREAFDPGELRDILWPAIACAEIIRRTLWGLLRVEYEAIKTCRHEIHLYSTGPQSLSHSSSANLDDLLSSLSQGGGVEMQPMSVAGSGEVSSSVGMYSMSNIGPSFTIDWNNNNDTSGLSKQQLLTELALWAVAFVTPGLMAAAHRAIK